MSARHAAEIAALDADEDIDGGTQVIARHHCRFDGGLASARLPSTCGHAGGGDRGAHQVIHR